MAFYKKYLSTVKGKDGQPINKYFPRSKTVGKPVTTDQLAKRISAESTVAPADVKAVLESLSGIMGDYMAQGRSVKLDGIGHFYFTATSSGNGVDTPEEVSANQIKGVRVRFIPETSYRPSGTSTAAGHAGRRAIRPLADVDIEWIDIESLLKTDDEEEPATPAPGGDTPGGDTPSGGGDNPGGDNPGGGGGDDSGNGSDE